MNYWALIPTILFVCGVICTLAMIVRANCKHWNEIDAIRKEATPRFDEYAEKIKESFDRDTLIDLAFEFENYANPIRFKLSRDQIIRMNRIYAFCMGKINVLARPKDA